MNHKRLEALRNLMERPGTKAEGDLARKMYEREMAKGGSSYQAPPPKQDPPKQDPFNWGGFRPPPPPPDLDTQWMYDYLNKRMADVFGFGHASHAEYFGKSWKSTINEAAEKIRKEEADRASARAGYFYSGGSGYTDPFQWAESEPPYQKQRKQQSVPVCPCGKVLERDPVSGNQFCDNELVHNHMKTLLANEFPVHSKVYYNGPLHPKNYSGVVLYDFYKACNWNQVMVRFDVDCLASASSTTYKGTTVNAFYCGTMRLTKQPIA